MRKNKQCLKRGIALLLAFTSLFGVAATAFAATTISDVDNSFDYFEYKGSDSNWHDLNTPYHQDNSTGLWAYCIDHEKDPPSSSTQYNQVNPSTIFSSGTINGIQAILDNGYPANDGGLGMAKAHYATANAIRAWIRESAGQGYNFMLVSNGNIRVKSGYQDVWNFFTQLLNAARSGQTSGGGQAGQIYVSPQSPRWSLSGGQLVAQVVVQSTQGYTISASTNQISVSGYTGGTYDVLTITAPLSLMGQDVGIYFQTPSSSGSVVLYWYEPNSSSKQGVVVTEVNTGGPGQSTSITITGEFYDLTVNKVDGYTGAALDGATFQLIYGGYAVGLRQTGPGQYAADGTQTTFTTNNGTAHISGLPGGITYTVSEVSAPSNAYSAGASQNVQLYGNSTVTIKNNPTKIVVQKTNALTGEAIPDITFSLIDGNGDPVPLMKHSDGTYRPASSGTNTFTVDDTGKATLLYLPKGRYTLLEPITKGYAELTDATFNLQGTIEITAYNDPLGLAIQKVDSYTGKTMPGIQFSLMNSSNEAIKVTKQSDGIYHYDPINGNTVFETGSNGTVSLYYIPADTYILHEQGNTVNDGYAAPQDVTVEVTRQNGSRSPATVRFANDPVTLEFTKACAVTKKLLDGGVFQLRDANGDIVKLKEIEPGSYRPDADGESTFTTKNGEAIIRYLKPQRYSIVELTAPEGYKPDTSKYVTVTDQNDVSNAAKANMLNQPIALEFQKIDQMTGTPMDGGTFSLKDVDGNVVKLSKVSNGVYTPDSKGGSTFTTYEGKAQIAPIQPGKYTITEEKAETGYAVAADMSVTVTEDHISSTPAKVTMQDAPLALRVEKLDDQTGKPVGGAVFKLMDGNTLIKLSPISGKPGWYKPDSGGGETFTMPQDGIVMIAYVPKKTLTLVEVSPGQGYSIITESSDIEITNETTYLSPAKASISNSPHIVEILKMDAYRDVPISGVKFRIVNTDGVNLRFSKDDDAGHTYSVNPNGVPMIETGPDGKATLRLIPSGEYSLVEDGNTGFAKADDVPFTVTDKNTLDAPVILTVTNVPLWFEVIKTDKITGKALSGVSFKATNSGNEPLHFTKQEDGTYFVTETGSETFLTGEDGIARIGYAEKGVITIEELEYPGYGILKPQNITITDENVYNNPATIELFNTPLAVELMKVDAYSKDALESVEFKLLDADGKHIPLALMSDGTYRPKAIAEAQATSEDEPNEKEADTATAEQQKTEDTQPVIIKEFTNTIKTDQKGMARLEYISQGKYRLEEQAFDGYVQLSGLEFEVSSEHTLDAPLLYTIYNVPTRLLIEKQNSVTKEPLLGAKFKLLDEQGKTIKLTKQEDGTYQPTKEGQTGIEVFELDKNAQAVITYLKAQKVSIVEEVAPAGYGKVEPIETEVGTEIILHTAAAAQAEDAENGNMIAETSVAVGDFPLTMKILKIHAKTQKPLQGASFQLYAEGTTTPLKFTYKDGAYHYDTAGTVTTIACNTNAEAIIYGLPISRYVLEEVVAPVNFFPAAPINCEIKLEHTSETPLEVIVVNTPTTKLGIDSDKFGAVIAIVATLLIGGALLVIYLRKRSKK